MLKRRRFKSQIKATVPARLKSQRGLAIIEALPLLVIFLILISYGMGLWGVIHTGILHSISARTYAFETFRNRTDLTYFRENDLSVVFHYEAEEVRFHMIQPVTNATDLFATPRPIAIGREQGERRGGSQDHNSRIYSIQERNREGGVEVNPAWVMIGYGMCLNVSCGGQ